MSLASAKTIPIGKVYAYWGDKRLGMGMGEAKVRYTKESVAGSIEETGLEVMNKKISETCEVDIVVADFNLERFRYQMDQAKSELSATTFATTNYESSTSAILRYHETAKLSGTTAATVSKGSYISGTVQVFKPDMSVEYKKGTDWTGTASAGTVKRIVAGAIPTGETCIIEYNKTGTVGTVHQGGNMADYEASLRLVHPLADGKMLQFYGYRAKHIGASELSISMSAAFKGIAMTFKLLADLTKEPGKQLFRWDREA